VTAREGRLLAFVTVRPGSGRPDSRDVRRYLSDVLPPYMVPARMTVVDALPLTGTGKVDRRALSDVAETPAERDRGPCGHGIGRADLAAGVARQSLTALSASLPAPKSLLAQPKSTAEIPEPKSLTPPTTVGRGTPPATPTERRLAGIWSELLEAGPVCREDDFFDLGGDSMLVLQVFARLGKQEGPLPRPTAVYRHRTLAALAGAVDAAMDAAVDTAAGQPRGTTTTAAARPAGEDHTAPFPLTPGQRGFLLAEELSPGGGAWLARLRLSGPLDQEVFQAAVDLLVERHAMLRTVFPFGARPPVQQELPRSLRLPVVFETLADRGDVDERAAAEADRRFEPWTWPLLRLRVLTLAPHEHVLLVHAHHLIGDGYSAALLMQELTDVYDRLAADRTAELSTPRATFRDHCLLLAERSPGAGASGRLSAGRRGTPSPAERPLPASGATRPRRRQRQYGSGSTAIVARPRVPLGGVRARREPDSSAAGARGGGGGDPVRAPADRLPPAVDGGDRPSGPDRRAGGERPGPSAAGRAPDLRPVRRRRTGAAGRRSGTGAGGRTLRRCPAPDRRRGRGGADPRRRPAAARQWAAADVAVLLHLPGLLRAGRPQRRRADAVVGGRGQRVRPAVDGDGRVHGGAAGRGRAARDAPWVREGLLAAALDGFARSIRARLTRATSPEPAVRRQKPRETMDAALVGYLPAPDHLARLAGLPDGALPRADLRTMLFPDGAPRLLETVTTPLGRSGFVCVPLFADELGRDPGLVRHTGRAVSLAASLGARCVSLAGMIPSLTGYGFDVLSSVEGAVAVTTGHAATVVSVVKTVQAALDATGQKLADLDVAFVGWVRSAPPRWNCSSPRGHPPTTAAPAVRRTRQRTASDGTGPEPA
jgi:hypothetical protein